MLSCWMGKPMVKRISGPIWSGGYPLFDFEVFLDIEKNTKPDCLICTNTSGLNIAPWWILAPKMESLSPRKCGSFKGKPMETWGLEVWKILGFSILRQSHMIPYANLWFVRDCSFHPTYESFHCGSPTSRWSVARRCLEMFMAEISSLCSGIISNTLKRKRWKSETKQNTVGDGGTLALNCALKTSKNGQSWQSCSTTDMELAARYVEMHGIMHVWHVCEQNLLPKNKHP